MSAHPLAALFSSSQEPEDHTHKLSPEAQADNLRAAWAHYTSPKAFVPGQLLKARPGLGSLKNDPVAMYVRPLDSRNHGDRCIIKDGHERILWNKQDCMIAFTRDDGSLVFQPSDSDLWEPWPTPLPDSR